MPLVEAWDQRCFISHQYDEVDYSVIWATMSRDLPAFVEQLHIIRDHGDNPALADELLRELGDKGGADPP